MANQDIVESPLTTNPTVHFPSHGDVASSFSCSTTVASPGQLPTSLRPRPTRSVSLDSRKTPPTIPPTHANRTLVLCFDGTGDQFDADNSNIVQLVSLLKKNDTSKQMVYYQSGIGTYTTPQVANSFTSNISLTFDLMLAWNLDAHVMGGYEFLMQTYTAGDKICLFGFSRGAYTARSLAGMLQKVGLLPAHNIQQIPFAYKMYTQCDNVGWEQSNLFKKSFCIDVDIEFIGVWDTVDSVGLIPRSLPFTTSNTLVRTFRHALSLDERRGKYKANLWNRHKSYEENLSNTQDPASHPVKIGASLRLDLEDEDSSRKPKRWASEKEERILRLLEELHAKKEKRATDVEEVWFAGCHCDVGGGSVSNKTRNSLARIPLRWMIRECFKAGTGIMFDCEGLRQLGLDPLTLYPFVTPRPTPIPVDNAVIRERPQMSPSWIQRSLSFLRNLLLPRSVVDIVPAPVNATADEAIPVGTEEEEDLKDALSPMYDQLELQPAWWILEVLPLKLRYQRGDCSWVSYVGLNRGRERYIPSQHNSGLKIHRTVKTRMDAFCPGSSRKYLPRPDIRVDPQWID